MQNESTSSIECSLAKEAMKIIDARDVNRITVSTKNIIGSSSATSSIVSGCVIELSTVEFASLLGHKLRTTPTRYYIKKQLIIRKNVIVSTEFSDEILDRIQKEAIETVFIRDVIAEMHKQQLEERGVSYLSGIVETDFARISSISSQHIINGESFAVVRT